MKKLSFALMLMMALAVSFMGCQKEPPTVTIDPECHSETFTLGETTYNVDDFFTVENIQYDGSQVYNVIVLSQHQMIGENGGEGQGVFLIFRGAITAGTYELTAPQMDSLGFSLDSLSMDVIESWNNYPMYFFAELEVEDMVTFSLDYLMEQENLYVACAGVFTLEVEDDGFTITTDGIEVVKMNDPAIIETSSVDFAGAPDSYVLATVEEGNINGVDIVTAYASNFDPNISFSWMELKCVCFITRDGNMLVYPYPDAIPTGIIEDTVLMYVEGMSIYQPYSGSGTVTIEEENGIYTVDAPEVTINGTSYALHYVGTLPFFDFSLY